MPVMTDPTVHPGIFRQPDPSIEALHRALSPEVDVPRKPNDMSLEEWQKKLDRDRARALFTRAFERPHITLDDLLPQRCVVAWRLTREMARLRGFVAPDESLTEMHDDAGDFWTVPRGLVLETGSWQTGHYTPEVGQSMREAEALGENYRVIVNLDEQEEKEGLALTPPPVPLAYREDDGSIMEDYDPSKDRLLAVWLRLIDTLCRNMGIMAGSKDHPMLGRDGYAPLSRPMTARVAWPSHFQLVAFESMLIEEVLDLMVRGSLASLKREMKHRYGLIPYEVDQLVKMAKIQARAAIESDVEDDRGVMAMRLEDFVKRAQDSLDLRAELAGLKQLSIVLGLSRVEPHDTMRDIIGIIAEGANQRAESRKLVSNTAPSALPGATSEVVGSQGEDID